jgi:ABC-2 type transport system permease protein
MKKTWRVMRAEIEATLRRKLFTIFAFVLPLAIGAVVLVYSLVGGGEARSPADAGEKQPAVSVVGREGLVDEAGLIQALPPGVPSSWLVRYPGEAAAQAALAAGEISGYYVIPADYMPRGEIVYARPEYNPLSDEAPAGEMEWVLSYNLLGGDAWLASRVREPLNLFVTELDAADKEAYANHWLGELFPVLMVLILYMAIVLPAGGLVNAISDEKKNRVMEVLMTSVSERQFITGKILALGLLGLAQIATWAGVMWAVIRFGARPLALPPGFTIPSGVIAWAVAGFLLGYAIYGTMLAGLGALAPDVKDTRSATMVIMGPLILAYMFLTPVLVQPDGPLAVALSLFPLTSSIAMIARLSVTAVPLWQMILAASLQLAAAVGILYLIARLFRAQTLLSGQPFSTARFFRAVAGRPS